MTRSQPVGIWVGSLDERRDPLAVVRAAEQTSTTLLIVGDGPLRPEVERAAGAHVHMLGQRNDVPNLLRASDFFVLMSQREGLSFALLEAMACGLPAIVADIPENIEAVGDTGLAVPYGDEEATAAAFRRLAARRARTHHPRRARATARQRPIRRGRHGRADECGLRRGARVQVDAEAEGHALEKRDPVIDHLARKSRQRDLGRRQLSTRRIRPRRAARSCENTTASPVTTIASVTTARAATRLLRTPYRRRK